MDYTYLFSDIKGKKTKIGVIGATKGYGYTLLAQILHVDSIVLRTICSRHPEECVDVLKELGYDESKIVVCESKEEIETAGEDAIIVVSDYKLVIESGIDSLVECTGHTATSLDAAISSLNKGINVYMVSKETDSVCGPYLNNLAAKNGAVYSLVNGDQPRNLIDLYSWGRALGMDIVALGKSSEYDFIYDSETGDFTYQEGDFASEPAHFPEFEKCWKFEGVETLKERQRILQKFTGSITADLCEMNLVSNVTGFGAATEGLSYPIARISELADIFIPEEDGGILKETGVVDVFYNLRKPDEASFAGGVFMIVRCTDAKAWEMMRGKGHVVSRNGKYACLYLPYHIMGLETATTIMLGDFKGLGTHPECRQVSVMAAVAEKDFTKGETFTVHGHHHVIDGLRPELLTQSELSQSIVPFYLQNGLTLIRDVKAGEYITEDMFDLTGNYPYEIYKKGLELK